MNEPLTNGDNGARDELGRFMEGNPGGPGRPKSSRHRLSEAFFKTLADDYDENGKAAIEQWRAANPGEYAKLIAGLQQKESSVDVTHKAIESVSDAQARTIAERVLARAGRVRSD